MWISFNINSYVRVQMTDEGKRLMRRNYREKFPQLEYRDPEEDAEGWSKWQLWELMQEFGDSLFNGCRVPFKTEIKLETPALGKTAAEGETK